MLLELLGRPGLTDEQRRETISAMAQLEKIDESEVIQKALLSIDYGPGTADVGVAFDLMRQLKGMRSRGSVLQFFALCARREVLRQLAFASIVNFDGNADEAWKLALGSKKPVHELQSFVECVPYISDASVRAGLYDRIAPLLDGLPQALGGTRAARKRRRRTTRKPPPRLRSDAPRCGL